MSAIRCIEAYFCESFKVAETVLIILSHWVVLSSFFEADWWHFTDPSNTGMSLKAIVIIVVALFVPPICFQLKRFVFGKKIHFLIFVLLKILLSALLFISSMPVVSHFPWVRTGLLASGVALSPLLLSVILSYHTGQNFRLKRRDYCDCTTANCCLAAIAHTQASDLSLETAHLSKFSVQNCWKSRDEYPEAMFLVAVLLNMVIRWAFATVNIFYEAWQASLVLLICLTVLAFISSILVRRTRFHTQLRNRKSNCSASTHTEIVLATDVGDKVPSPKAEKFITKDSNKNFTSSNHRDSLVKLTSLTDDEDTLSSESNSPPPFEKSYSENFGVSSSPRIALLFLAGGVQGFALGTLIVLYLWVFSTPNLLARWSGEDPDSHGVLVIAFLAVGVIVSVFVKIVLNATCQSSSNVSKRNYKNDQMSCWFLDVFILAFLIGLLICAAILQMQGSSGPHSFVGSSMLCVVLPCCFTVNYIGITRLLDICVSMHSTPLLVSCFHSVVAFLVVIAFLISHIILVLFINPQIISLFLGRMDIIMAYQVLVIIASLTTATITNRIFHIRQRRFDTRRTIDQSTFSDDDVSNATFSKKRPLVVLLFCVILLTTGFIIRPVFSPQPCFQDHEASYCRLTRVYANRNRTSDTFSVLSWNILLGHDKHGRDNLPCISKTLQALKPDVIGVEESEALPPYWGGKDIPAYLTRFLGDGIKSYLGVQPLKSSLGVTFLTNHTVIKHQSYLLPADDTNKLPHYSLVRIDCLFNNHSITIFNVHAVFKNWTATDNNVSPFANTSDKHINFIAQKVFTIDQNQPIIVMGDFNLNPNEPQLDILHKLGFQSALHKQRDISPPSTLRNRFAIVDHIFYRGLTLSESRTVVETEDMSDHLPVIAYFKLPT